jgi:DNA polymerase sigma
VTILSQKKLPVDLLSSLCKDMDRAGFKSHQITHDLVVCARVPLLRVRDHNMNENADITLNNIAGVLNSMMLRIYSQLNDSVAELGRRIKCWGKEKGLVHKSKFSCYGLLLMMLHFLIDKKLVPCLIRGNQAPSLRVTYSTDLPRLRKLARDFVVEHEFVQFQRFIGRFALESVYKISVSDRRTSLKN